MTDWNTLFQDRNPLPKKDRGMVIWGSSLNFYDRDWNAEIQEAQARDPSMDAYTFFDLEYQYNIGYKQNDEYRRLDVVLPEPVVAFNGCDCFEVGKTLSSIFNINNFDPCDNLNSQVWFVNEVGDVKYCEFDKTNNLLRYSYTFRMWKPNVSEKDRRRMIAKIRCGKASQAEVTRLTDRLGDHIAKAYGWELPPQRKKERLER